MSKVLATAPRNPKPRPPAGKAARNKKLDKGTAVLVNSPSLPANPPALETAPAQPSATPTQPVVQEKKKMELTFVRSKAERKDSRLVIYNFADGRPGSVQFLRTAFPEQIPETITMSGDFAEKETPEQRKARLASLPKLTVAEKVAKGEERLAKLRAKLAAGQPAAEQNAGM